MSIQMKQKITEEEGDMDLNNQSPKKSLEEGAYTILPLLTMYSNLQRNYIYLSSSNTLKLSLI